MDSREKFSSKSKHYSIGRPSYPTELYRYIIEKYNFENNKVLADIGSGTGKFCDYFIKNNYKVYAVEPNENMRNEAERLYVNFENFISVSGDSNNTTLSDNSADIISVAQAFHWFDRRQFRRECVRILKDNGLCLLIWNNRNTDSECNKALYSLFTELCPMFKGFSGGMRDKEKAISQFFDKYEMISFSNKVEYDLDTFLSRNMSVSYALNENDINFSVFYSRLNDIFIEYSEKGLITENYETVCFSGKFN